MRIVKKLPDFNSIAAGQTAIADIPTGLPYYDFRLRMKENNTDVTEAQIAAMVNEIRILVNGDIEHRYNGAQLLAMNKYYGYVHKAGQIPIYLARPWQRLAANEIALRWGTADVQTMRMEIDINAAAINPKIELYAQQAPEGNEPLGVHYTVKRHTFSATAVGIREISDLPRGNHAYGALHFYTPVASILDMEVEANQKVLYKADRAIMLSVLEDEGARHWPQANYFHVDFSPTKLISDALLTSLLQDLRVRANMSGADTITVLAERLEGFSPAVVAKK